MSKLRLAILSGAFVGGVVGLLIGALLGKGTSILLPGLGLIIAGSLVAGLVGGLIGIVIGSVIGLFAGKIISRKTYP